ncbi:MAG: cyclodeaminase/cyclohydrolase family protein [Ignavibacteriales bacterium]|nr:cyclodeaminase/cyclohydrolase family protein [Ignavibacteriales bacterium]
MLALKTISDFIDNVASDSPAPGGGSVSALAAALGAGLTSMVCRLTIGKKKYEDVQADMIDILGQADELRARLTSLIDQDTEAFNGVMRAFGMPRGTDEEKQKRSEAIQDATKEATLIPLEVMKLSEKALVLAKEVAEEGNVNSISDAGVAGLMLKAACEGAALNVRINLATLKDGVFVGETKALTDAVATNVEVLADGLRKRVESVLG